MKSLASLFSLSVHKLLMCKDISLCPSSFSRIEFVLVLRQEDSEVERRTCFSTKHKIIFFVVSLSFVLLAGLSNYTYRPYFYSHHVFDFHLADCLPNLCAVPACVFLYLALAKRIDHRPHYYVLCACFGLIIYEALFSLTFGLFDVFATLVSSVLTYLAVKCIMAASLPRCIAQGRGGRHRGRRSELPYPVA